MKRQPFDRTTFVSEQERALGARPAPPDYTDRVRRFNYRQSSITAREPTALELAFRAAAGPPNEEARGGKPRASVQGDDESKLHGNDTPVAAHLQRLAALYGKGGAS